MHTVGTATKGSVEKALNSPVPLYSAGHLSSDSWRVFQGKALALSRNNLFSQVAHRHGNTRTTSSPCESQGGKSRYLGCLSNVTEPKVHWSTSPPKDEIIGAHRKKVQYLQADVHARVATDMRKTLKPGLGPESLSS